MYSNSYDDLILNPSGSEWVDWGKVKDSTSIDELERFMAAHPDSAHVPVAKHKVEILQQNIAETEWAKLKESSDPAQLQSFRDRYPASPHAAEADRKIGPLRQKAEEAQREAAAWDQAKAALTSPRSMRRPTQFVARGRSRSR